MTLEQVHELARSFERKNRFVPAVMAAALVLVGFITGLMWLGAHDTLHRVTAILFAAGQVGCFAVIYRMLFPSRDPAEPISGYLRRRMLRGLSYMRGGLALALLPLAPFMLVGLYQVMAFGRGPVWTRLMPLLILAVALAFVVARARVGARRTRAALQELDDLLKR